MLAAGRSPHAGPHHHQCSIMSVMSTCPANAGTSGCHNSGRHGELPHRRLRYRAAVSAVSLFRSGPADAVEEAARVFAAAAAACVPSLEVGGRTSAPPASTRSPRRWSPHAPPTAPCPPGALCPPGGACSTSPPSPRRCAASCAPSSRPPTRSSPPGGHGHRLGRAASRVPATTPMATVPIEGLIADKDALEQRLLTNS